MSDIRGNIRKQLELSHLIDKVASAVSHFNNTDLKCIASMCRLDYMALTIKINMLKKKKSYWDKKEKLETAVKEVFHKTNYLPVVAFKHKLDIDELEKIYYNWLDLEDSVSYEYDEDKIGNFTFVEESLLLKQLYKWEKYCQCPCQVCAMEQLQIIAYRFAQQKNKQCPQTWLECGKADLSWLSNFIIEYIGEISKLKRADECRIDSQTSMNVLQPFVVRSFERQIREISELIILYTYNMQGSSQLSNVQIMPDIREKVARHLEMSPRLDKAAKEVLHENKNIIDIALKYNLDFWIFKRKVEIIKETNIYLDLKFKFENAMDEVLNQSASLTDIAKKYYIDKRHLKTEFIEYLHLYRKNKILYKYDKIIKPNGVFTSSQEESLLLLLNIWKRYSTCSCQVCIFEHLLKLTYSFAKLNEIQYPSEWNINEEADEFWFCEFEMRYTTKISSQFVFANSCTKEPPESSNGSQFPSSFDRQKISEPNTSHAHMQMQLSNVDVTESDNVRKRIETHLKLSRRLDEAAKEVLDKNKYIASVARYYELDLWLLNQKLHILKFKRLQFDTKNKIESSLNDILYNNISVSRAAEKYKIDEEIIDANWEQWKNLESGIYTYDAFTMDDQIFTFSQEFLLLKQLRRLSIENLNCNCQICVLEYLRSVAYKFAKEIIHERCPIEWFANAKADELWMYEFEMRHSIEISKYDLHHRNLCRH